MADTFKIVNATELNANLELIADALRTKLGDNSLTFTFPNGFVSAIDQLALPTSEPEEPEE